jgi:hypothetical protein
MLKGKVERARVREYREILYFSLSFVGNLKGL